MNYKLCILAAGRGSRMGELTKDVNKAILPLDFKATISHVIEKHNDSIEIVIALNYKYNSIKEYLYCAYPKRNIKYIFVDNISEKGCGPGYSLLCCKKYLQSPFIISTVDTITKEAWPTPDKNWIGIDLVNDSKDFCTVSLKEKTTYIKDIKDKENCENKFAFIGIAGIKDYNLFFSSLEKDKKYIKNELQLSNGLKGLIKKGLIGTRFSWIDVGNKRNYNQAKQKFLKNDNFDFSKNDEYIYFVENRIIKYFKDSEVIKNRYYRNKLLKGITPKIDKCTKNFYSYKKIKGEVIYEQKNPEIIYKLLDWLKNKLWIKKNIEQKDFTIFKNYCLEFYYKKTTNRVAKFYKIFGEKDVGGIVNNIKVESVNYILDKINFEKLSEGIPSNFHGDLQFDNILLTKNKEFKLLDWRQDFSGILDYGDLYYDLAKLNGGIYVSYKKVKNGDFKYKGDLTDCMISISNDKFLSNSKLIFNKFVKENNLDLNRIEILTGLIFLNMSPMHNKPFSHYIYNYGRLHLTKWCKN